MSKWQSIIQKSQKFHFRRNELLHMFFQKILIRKSLPKISASSPAAKSSVHGHSIKYRISKKSVTPQTLFRMVSITAYLRKRFQHN